MPVSLSAWRVRIGRYVQPIQGDTASILKSCRTHLKSVLKLLSVTYMPRRTQKSTEKFGSACKTKDCLTSLREYIYIVESWRIQRSLCWFLWLVVNPKRQIHAFSKSTLHFVLFRQCDEKLINFLKLDRRNKQPAVLNSSAGKSILDICARSTLICIPTIIYTLQEVTHLGLDQLYIFFNHRCIFGFISPCWLSFETKAVYLYFHWYLGWLLCRNMCKVSTMGSIAKVKCCKSAPIR